MAVRSLALAHVKPKLLILSETLQPSLLRCRCCMWKDSGMPRRCMYGTAQTLAPSHTGENALQHG